MNDQRETPIERRRFILEHAQEGDSLILTDLATKFGVTKSSIYRDLAFLRDLGIPIGTKGGVVSMGDTATATILREIKFPPKYKQAGVGVLSYFSTVLAQRYPETEAAVTITQSGEVVTLKVESSRGDVEIIERTLSEYGRVVVGDLPVSDFLSDPIEAMQLKNKLEITALELRLKEQSFLQQTGEHIRRIESLEKETSELRALIGLQLTTVHHLGSALGQLAEAERLSPAAARAMESISSLIGAEHNARVETELRQALETLRKEDVGLYERVKRSLSSVGHAVATNVSTQWIMTLINSLP